MTDTVRFFKGALALAFALVLAGAAAARDLSPRQLKKSLKEADEKWSDGDVDAAVDVYEEILAATEPGATERADALYALIVVSLGPDGRDLGRARTLLSEFEAFPRYPRRLEVRTLAGLMDSAESAGTELRRVEAELAQVLDDLESDRRQPEAETAAAESLETSLEAQIETLAEKLAKAEEELASKDDELRAVRAELAKKEEALEKLRQRVVGRPGGD